MKNLEKIYDYIQKCREEGNNDLRQILDFIDNLKDIKYFRSKLYKSLKIPPPVPFVDEVEKFNKTFGKINNYKPTIPEEKEWRFVYDFILEELEEYKEACEKGDIIGILDAICDITYVSLGNSVMLHGLKDKIGPAYAEIQASNMSKSCKTLEEAEKTVKLRSKEQGEPCHYEMVGQKWVVYRTRDKKVMKSINYFKPDLDQFFTDEELIKLHNPRTII